MSWTDFAKEFVSLFVNYLPLKEMAWCGGSPLPVVEVIMKKQESSPKRQEEGSVIMKMILCYQKIQTGSNIWWQMSDNSNGRQMSENLNWCQMSADKCLKIQTRVKYLESNVWHQTSEIPKQESNVWRQMSP